MTATLNRGQIQELARIERGLEFATKELFQLNYGNDTSDLQATFWAAGAEISIQLPREQVKAAIQAKIDALTQRARLLGVTLVLEA